MGKTVTTELAYLNPSKLKILMITQGHQVVHLVGLQQL